MNRLLVLGLLLGVMVLTAKAQRWEVDYSVHAGVNGSEYAIGNVRSGVSRESLRAYNGFLGGLVTFSPFKYGGIQTGLSVNGLGAKLEKSEFGTRDVLQHSYWLQAPLNLVGKLPLRDSSNFFLSAGGYVGIGLFGKNYVPDSYDGTAARDFTFGTTGTQQQMDYGANFSLGYRMRNGYTVSVGYMRGLRDLAPDQAAYEQRNRAYSFSIGYQF